MSLLSGSSPHPVAADPRGVRDRNRRGDRRRIVGTIVWIGITNDRKERLDRRLDEAAGFAIRSCPAGLTRSPESPNDQDAVITVRRAGDVTSNSTVVLPDLPAGYADTYVDGVRYRVRTVEIPVPEPCRSPSAPPTTPPSPTPTTCTAACS